MSNGPASWPYDIISNKRILGSTNGHLTDKERWVHIYINKGPKYSEVISQLFSTENAKPVRDRSGSGGLPSDNEQVVLQPVATEFIHAATEFRGSRNGKGAMPGQGRRLATANVLVHSARTALKRFIGNRFSVNIVGNLWEEGLVDMRFRT